MRTGFLRVLLAAACGLTFTSMAQAAAPTMLQACASEMKKHGCERLSESHAYACLSRYDEPRMLNKGFDRKCFQAYARYEKVNGKGDRPETHKVDNPEHTN